MAGPGLEDDTSRPGRPLRRQDYLIHLGSDPEETANFFLSIYSPLLIHTRSKV
jgi:hypothetical protein